jgi:hypothetical protein
MGNLSDYLVNLYDLNLTVVLVGQALRDQLKAQVSEDIINMMFMLVPIPEDDDAFIQFVELVGQSIEEMERHA